MTELRISVADAIATIDADEWDACANPDAGTAGQVNITSALPAGGNGQHAGAAGIAMEQERRLVISKVIRAANMCSTTAGPRPMRAPAAAIILNCRSRCRSRLRPADASWCGKRKTRKPLRARWRAA